MSFIVSYVSALVVFGAMDAVWLKIMGPLLYRPTLAEILAPNPRLAPAILFYLVYPIGIVVFVVTPALRSGSVVGVFGLALLFGAIAYATYDLTNYATLRSWTLQITVLDIVYGAIASAVAATAAFVAVGFTAR